MQTAFKKATVAICVLLAVSAALLLPGFLGDSPTELTTQGEPRSSGAAPEIEQTESGAAPVDVQAPATQPAPTATAIPTTAAIATVVIPTVTPVPEPTASPTPIPTAQTAVTVAPTAVIEPTTEPTAVPAVAATAVPTVEPTAEPTVAPTVEPTVEPTATVESTATVEPTVEPTATVESTATVEPTATVESTATVEATATVEPTVTVEPTATVEPTVEATVEPTVEPTAEATAVPTVEANGLAPAWSWVGSDDGLFLRDAPGGQIVTVLNYRDQVHITGDVIAVGDRLWVQVDIPQAGWVALAFLTDEEPAAPVDTDSGSSEPLDPPTDAEWVAFRNCESGGRYDVVDPSGLYHGAYQFLPSTWDGLASRFWPELVGVLPSQASAADQDKMARKLFDLEGTSPWPTCGVHLR